MAVAPEAVIVDGQLVKPEWLMSLTKNVNLWLAGDLLAQLYGAGEWADDNASPHPVSSGSTPNDIGGTALRSYGFLGSGLRVAKATATTVTVSPGWGLQYDASPPAGEARQRVVRLAASKTLTIPLASSGHFRRDLVAVKWNDKTTNASVQILDAFGNISTSSQNALTTPEVDDTSPTIQRVAGTENTTTTWAARPAVPSGYIAIAEVLVSATGIDNNAQSDDGTAPGVRDLRPRLVPRKAAGAVEARRASSSMDEGSSVPSATRMSAKAVGEIVAHGLFSLTATLTSYTIDTGHDWRDMLVDVEHSSLFAEALLPGGGSDDGLTWNSSPVFGSATMATAGFYSGSGSTDGTVTYHSAASKTAADGSGATLTFYADSTTGALCLLGRTDAGVKYVYWRARGFGPCGKRNLSVREA